jgi:hypothetical protein
VRFLLKILRVLIVGEEEEVRGEVPFEDSQGSSGGEEEEVGREVPLEGSQGSSCRGRGGGEGRGSS